MELHKDSFLEDLGLAQQNQRPYLKKNLHIDKGEIDPKSYGGIAMLSTGNLDDDGILQNLDVRYWAINPDGRYEIQHLFQIETKKVKKNKLEISSLYVLGRQIELNDSKSVDNVIEAIRRIHVNLRDREPSLPDVASIFKDCCIEEIVGEKLPLPGFHAKSRIYFPISPSFNLTVNNEGKRELVLPLEAIRPLMGIRKNTIDADYSYMGTNRLRVRASVPPDGKKFEISSVLNKEKRPKRNINSRHLIISQQELDVPRGKSNLAKEMIEVSWNIINSKQGEKGHAVAKLISLRLFSSSLMGQPFREIFGAMGVINKTHGDMLKLRDYPRLRDHLAEYGHLESVSSSSPPPTSDGRFVLTSMGGNNLREIYPGIGEDIGGNCKVVETQWFDKKTETVRKLGAILDLGAYIIKVKSEMTGGGPDIVEKLKFCKDIFISHHHLDHLDFIIPYIKRGIITPEHTLHFTPEVYEMAKEKLNKWGVKKSDPRMPRLNLLSGAGVINLRDKEGVIRMSIAYGVDAVPHSAKDTPFIAYGRMGKRILGSYMYLGDMRYDEDWFANHESPFWDPVTLMLKHEPSLESQQKNLRPTYAEQDGTSSKRSGRGARESQIEENLVTMIDNCLFDKHIGMPIIGTNDGRRETGLRVANRTKRKVTAFGSAVEKIFEVANKWGVNPYRCERPEIGKYTGIADYLKWHAEQIGCVPTRFAGRTSGIVKDWFEHDKPGSILAFLSGSQGNPVEAESVTYKLAEGISYFDSDPKTSSTARPADLKDWAIIVSQGAIPGNQKYQKKLIKKLAARGAVVFEAFDDNTRIYNAGKIQNRIVNFMNSAGYSVIIEANTILIENFSIHASGHGRNGDFRLWLKKIQAKLFGVHHTDDMESVIVAYDTIEEEGYKHPNHSGRIFQNGIEVEIGTDFVKAIGQTHSSAILTKEITEEGKHYNKRLEAVRIINHDDRSPHNDLGLRGSSGGVLKTSFGIQEIQDIEQVNTFNRASNDDMASTILVRSDDCTSKPKRPHLRPVYIAPEWTPQQPRVA
jgi:hypothetical protein